RAVLRTELRSSRWCSWSHRPAGAAQRAPEGAVVGRHVQSPCMRMAVHAAGGAASAGGREGVLTLLVDAGTVLVAAESAHRRPVRHRRRQCWRQVLVVAVAIDGLATEKRQYGRDVLDRLARD